MALTRRRKGIERALAGWLSGVLESKRVERWSAVAWGRRRLQVLTVSVRFWRGLSSVRRDAHDARCAVIREKQGKVEAMRIAVLLSVRYRNAACAGPFTGWRVVQAYKASLATSQATMARSKWVQALSPLFVAWRHFSRCARLTTSTVNGLSRRRARGVLRGAMTGWKSRHRVLRRARRLAGRAKAASESNAVGLGFAAWARAQELVAMAHFLRARAGKRFLGRALVGWEDAVVRTRVLDLCGMRIACRVELGLLRLVVWAWAWVWQRSRALRVALVRCGMRADLRRTRACVDALRRECARGVLLKRVEASEEGRRRRGLGEGAFGGWASVAVGRRRRGRDLTVVRQRAWRGVLGRAIVVWRMRSLDHTLHQTCKPQTRPETRGIQALIPQTLDPPTPRHTTPRPPIGKPLNLKP